jgi:hypothetical protein
MEIPMLPMPPDLIDVLPDGCTDTVGQWWDRLPGEQQLHLASAWDSRIEVSFFSPQENEEGVMDDWDNVPTVHGSNFIPRDDSDRNDWMISYFEYLLANPELLLAFNINDRSFHTGCQQHQAARICISNGGVPCGFACPLKLIQCPMHSLRGAKLNRCSFDTKSGQNRKISK